MKQLLIAFDCDGTLIRDGATEDHTIVANERIRQLLIAMAHMKNVKIMVWSGGGELWARQVAAAIGIDSYVDRYADKYMVGKDNDGHPLFNPQDHPDIAIDDIQDCELGTMNLIVREK